MDDPPWSKVPFRKHRDPQSIPAAVRENGTIPIEHLRALGHIWDEVVHRIVGTMLAHDDDPSTLHINLREEMILELAMLDLWLGERVFEKRGAGRDLSEIDIDAERAWCLGPEGEPAIRETAAIAHDRIWSRLMEERWKPKTAKTLEREANPRERKLAVKKVNRNHFIPRSFIRDYWSRDGKVVRWRRQGDGWQAARRSFGAWGFRHNLHNDRLEAMLGQAEGDATEPIRMLIQTRPLNIPQRTAFIGFLVLQIMRNPFFPDQRRSELVTMLERLNLDETALAPGAEDHPGRSAFYLDLARPIMEHDWALVRAPSPLFVLPDTFCARSPLGPGMQLLVPLTPSICLVTLRAARGSLVIPHWLSADEELSLRLSRALLAASASEFLADPSFTPDGIPAVPLDAILEEVEEAVVRKIADGY